MKVKVDKPTVKEDVEEIDVIAQAKALSTDAKAFAENEKQLELEHEKDLPPLTAKELKHDLGGDYKGRLEGDRSIVLTMKHGERPTVNFGGFWNGKLVNNAMNAISRAYRLQRHKDVRANAHAPNTKENGDG